jgi:hypothetical protein
MKKKLVAATITSMVLSIASTNPLITGTGSGNDAFAAPYKSPPPPPPPPYRSPPPPPPYRAPASPPYRAPAPPPYKAPDRTQQRQQENRAADRNRDAQNRATQDSIRKQQADTDRRKRELDKQQNKK